MLCIFVISKPHNKPFFMIYSSCSLSPCFKMSTSFLKSCIVFSLAVYEIHVNSCFSENPSFCHHLSDVSCGRPENLLRHIATILIFHMHTYPQINNMSVWFMVAEAEWRSCVYLWVFLFCLSICNTQSLLLFSETEHMWFSASLTDNMLSHNVLHPKKTATM